ncbi:MAG: carbohydrate binding family 9 domain-containing protein, partial [Gemmatimonadota bacterium]
MLWHAIALAVLLLLPGEQVVGQSSDNGDEARVVQAVQLEPSENVELDGQLVEPIWNRALPATEFLQREPVEGAMPSESTAVYVVFDQDNLYIGAILFDDPDGILAYQKQRDAQLSTDDRFMWILDTFLDGRTGYFFEINPAGLMGDGLLGGAGFGVNKSWDGIWEARTHRRPDGWSAEIRIPFRTLNF